MMRAFEFTTASEIVFGVGSVKQLPKLAHRHGIRRVMLLTGRSPERAANIVISLAEEQIKGSTFTISGEPSVDTVREGVSCFRQNSCDGVIAIGGGSVLDAAKAIATLIRNPGDVTDYLEVIGEGKQIVHPSAPWIAVPTTAGTGAEVTRNAVLFSPEHRVKVSLRGAALLPVAALVDPELTLSLPRELSLSSGMDALTQLIEPYVSNRANVLTDGFCLQGLPMASRSLLRVCSDAKDLHARTEMSAASLLSGLALANAGLGVVHGFAGPLGGMFSAPHGAICAALLPYGIEGNLAFLRRAPESDHHVAETLKRFRVVAQYLTGNVDAQPEDSVTYLRDLGRKLGVRPLRSFGMGEEHADAVVAKAERASSMQANPVKLSTSELKDIYRKAL